MKINMDINIIQKGVGYRGVRNAIIKSDNLTIGCLPASCQSVYEVVENLDTKEKVHILIDSDKRNIIDVTDDFYKAVDADRAGRNLKEILFNNGY